MSTHFLLEIVDEAADDEFATGKSTNSKSLRTRFMKVGDPPGTMKLQVLNNAKDEVLAESNSLLCNFTSEAEYVGANDDVVMAWIRFDFSDELVASQQTIHLRLLPDSTYFAGRDDSNHLNLIIDYPKPTNDTDGTIEALGRNFSRYPRKVMQMFGRDFGGITQ